MKNWGFYIAVAVGLFAYNAYTDADRDSSGAIIDGGSVDVFDIKVGDCFNDGSSLDEVSSLPGVPCSEPHDNEAYAVFNMTAASYPSEDEMWEMAYDACLDRFEGFVGKDYESSQLDIYTLYPSAEGWKQNDREVICAVYDMDAAKLEGSVRGLGL